MMKWPHFLPVDTNSWKLNVGRKILGWFSQKWVLPLCSQDPRIGCISKRNKCGKLIFCILIQTHEN